MKPKKNSRTLWFNGLSLAAKALTLAADVVPPQWILYVLIVESIINGLLRLDTSEKLA